MRTAATTDRNIRRATAAALLAIGGTGTLRAQLAASPYSAADSTYTQNFDNLLSPVPANATEVSATVLPPGVSFVEAGANADASLRVDNGSSSTGDTFLYGATGSNERALGAYASGSLTSQYGITLRNNTGATLNQFTLSYTGEQWKDGGSGMAVINTETFSYAVGALTLNATTGYTQVADLDFRALVNNTTADRTLNGNSSEYSRQIGATVSGINWTAGSTLTLRWTDQNDPGNDDGLAIDDLAFSATVPEPATAAAGFLMLGALGWSLRRQTRSRAT